MSYIIRMSEGCDGNLIGSKGAGLAFLLKRGFNVPETYALTCDAYSSFVKKSGLDTIISRIVRDVACDAGTKSRKISEAIMSKGSMAGFAEELKMCGFIDDQRSSWAVRSSSNLEDLSGNSFAGLYDTFLDIREMPALEEAVKKCWASLWSERALVYRKIKGFDKERAAMAVLIQRMVKSLYSGVFFTAAPDGSNNGEMYLEYCSGPGEGLVSGKISPYSCRISSEGTVITRLSGPKKDGLPEDKIRELAVLAVKAEEAFGCPQDIEWAYDGEKFYFLQSRPVVFAKSGEQQPDPAVWTRANVGEVFPEAITPLTWKIFQATILNDPGLARLGPESDRKVDSAGIKVVNGLVYIKIDPFLDSFCYLPFVTAHTLNRVLGVEQGVRTDSYRPPRGLMVRLAQALFLLNVLGVYPRLQMICRPFAGKFGKIGRMADARSLIAWNARCFRVHLKATAYAVGAFALLEHFLRKRIGARADTVLPEILSGREDLQTASQGVSLAALAREASGSVFLRSLISGNEPCAEVAGKLRGSDEGRRFLKKLEDFMVDNGARAAGEFELSTARWREDTAFIFLLLRKFVALGGNADPVRDYCDKSKRRQAEAAAIASSLPFCYRWFFIRLLDSYRDFSTLRENMKYRLIEGYAALRALYLDKAKGLVARGVISETADIFFLCPDEVDGAEEGKEVVSLIKERKHRHERETAAAHSAAVNCSGFEKDAVQGEMLRGLPCSPGTVRGAARVLKDITQASELVPGEIMVAKYTDPGWTPLFLLCKAVVTEIGGFLSHGATVAREYGIPAVVNLPAASTKIRTGDIITVNGTEGLVIIEKPGERC